jgi:hypothetical protein
MNSDTSPCDHMIFVAKSSPERTRVPRCVTDRLTIRRLVNINPGRPRTSSTVAPRKSQNHHLWSPRSESKRFSFLKQAHGVKRAIKEAGEGGGAAAPAHRSLRRSRRPRPPSLRRCRRHRPPSPRRCRRPPPEEVKGLKPPRRKVARQSVVPLRSPKVHYSDACFTVKMLYEAW